MTGGVTGARGMGYRRAVITHHDYFPPTAQIGHAALRVLACFPARWSAIS
jgi:hypothetical protein